MVKYKLLNYTNRKISEIGIGTWKMGIDPSKEKDALKTAIGLGLRFIDTAEMYATEWVVKNAIKGQKDVFVATKVSPSHFNYNDVITACDRSLTNLGVTKIDLYQLHWPNHRIPIKETMGAMEELVDAGKVGHIGVSNFTVKELIEAQNAMERYEIVSNQVEYSVLVREIEKELLDFCTDNKITVIAYSPLGAGALYSPKYAKTFEALGSIGKAHGKSATQVALNWLISKRNVVAIPKTGSKDHVREIAGASGWKLTRGEISEINAINERKWPIAGILHPMLKNTAWWAKAMQSFNEKRAMAHQNMSTTMSSKK
jgi:diketogulonate reductase-like aldo/keto reductase